MTSAIPNHLQKYIVEQDISRYSPQDQSTWRYIMRQLTHFLAQHAHPSYIPGLKKCGILVDTIPVISNVDEHLQKFGWRAVPVSGFIPPAAFMELQSLGILPIASDMRTMEHILYTPAPDIVHEAAGHAPILSVPEYATYLKEYGEVARHAILSKEDLDQYEAIRILSDLKEDPTATSDQISVAQSRLDEITRSMTDTSEAALLSRMNWWTAEYGLIGPLANPKIFGAGLLSSVGESKSCLAASVKKIPLSLDCVNFSYDITEPQPQLFVARDFAHLSEVLEQLAATMAFRLGGISGLNRALKSRTINTVALDSGLLISGQIESFLASSATDASSESIDFLKFRGPCQLAIDGQEISGQGPSNHPDGFSTPLGRITGEERCLSTFNQNDLVELGIRTGHSAKLNFSSGFVVEGIVTHLLFKDQKLLIITWNQCTVSRGDTIYFQPEWGSFDMAVGSKVSSVWGGPADRASFGEVDDFIAARVPRRTYSSTELVHHQIFECLRKLRISQPSNLKEQWTAMANQYLSDTDAPWLIGLELFELAAEADLDAELGRLIQNRIAASQAGRDGLKIASLDL